MSKSLADFLREPNRDAKAIYKNYFNESKKITSKYFRKLDDIEDVFQESLKKFLQFCIKNQFDPKLCSDPYFFKIVDNFCKDSVKNKNRILQIEDHPNLNHLADDLVGVTDILYNQQRNKIVIKIIQNMEFPCKEILYFHYFLGDKLKDIAIELGLSEDNTRQRKKSCLEKFKNIIVNHPFKD